MSWPVSQDYNEAVQNPRTSFADPELREAEAVANALGLPVPRSGNFADVYELRRGEARWAVKCFTREVAGLRDRYAEISAHLSQARLPFGVEFAYLEEGIRVRNRWYPVLKMQWVEGLLLNEFVRDHLDRPIQLGKLSLLWRKMAGRLREAGMAHGDLQHGNVLLVPSSRAASLALKLIDYDGMFVPALAGRTSGEIGHPSYQHPQRLRDATYGPEVDRFPLLVIATALRCLMVSGKSLWPRFDTGDNLLFRQTDLKAPGQSALFRELWHLPDATARAAVARLALACLDPLDQTPRLEDLPSDDVPLALTAEQRHRVVELLGPEPVRTPVVSVPRVVDEIDVELVEGPIEPARNSSRRSSLPIGLWIATAALVLVALILLPVVLLSWTTGESDTALSIVDNPERKSEDPPAETRREVAPTTKRETAPATKRDTARATQRDTARATQRDTGRTRPRPARIPPPDAAEVNQADKDLRARYKEELARRDPASLRNLALRLLKVAADEETELAYRFVSLRMGSELAARANDLVLAFRLVDELATRFLVYDKGFKVKALELAADATVSNEKAFPIVMHCLALAEDAQNRDFYSEGMRLLEVARKTVEVTGDAFLVELVASRRKSMERLQREFTAIQTARRNLGMKQSSSESFLEMGKFACFRRGDWGRGLPLLAIGSDREYAALAKRDLAAAKDPPDALARLAEAWWDLAEMETGITETHLRERARYWYVRALSGLTDEARQTAEERLTIQVGTESLRPGLVAEYCRGDTFDVIRRHKGRLDSNIEFLWGINPPDSAVPEGAFSCRWQGYVVPPIPGMYQIVFRGPGRVRIELDGREIKQETAGTRLAAPMRLAAPVHQLVVEYSHKGPAAPIAFLWSRVGVFDETVVPANVLYHNLAQERRLAAP